MRVRGVAWLLALPLASCGGGGGGTGPGNELTLSLAAPSGDAQAASPLTVLAPFRVRAQMGALPASGLVVSWAIVAGQGTLSTPSSVTDAQGLAQVTLTLGLNGGLSQVRATLTGAAGSPITFTATAVIPGQFVQVEVENDQFDPASVQLTVGGTVAWVWAGSSRQHNILPIAPATRPNQPTVRDGPFTYEDTFPAPGTYRYYCSIHGTPNSGMRGEVVVQ